MTHFPLFWLVIFTLGVVVALAAWGYVSTRRRQKYGSSAKGLGSDKDPMA